MKRILYLLPVLFLIISACEKDKNNDPYIETCLTNPSWTGPWQLSSYWYSPGTGDVQWSPATGKQSINFIQPNTFSSTTSNYDRYLVTQEATMTILKLYKQDKTDTTSFILKVSTDTLYLHNRACIEGCPERYVRPAVSH